MSLLREILTSIKEIILDFVKHRLFPVTVLVIVMFFILVKRLFALQIVEGQEHMENFIYKTEKTLTIESVRGNIFDRNGKLLAYNELSYSVVYSNNNNVETRAKELGISESELRNQIVHRTIQILESNNDRLFVDFPIQLTASGSYEFTIYETQLENFKKDVYGANSFDSLTDEHKNATAEEIVEYLCTKRFEISDKYSREEQLKILSCRYKLWQNRFQQYMPVTIAYDISEASNAAITEYCDELLGMEVAVKSLRRYNDAKYFAHIIGYIGAISDTELSEYNSKYTGTSRYTAEDIVGKTGIEQYCQEYLRGTRGYETMYVDNLGKVIENVETVPASAGNDVYLTIDADLEKYCYDTLEKEIASIILSNLTPELYVTPSENYQIAISEVYFGLFNNHYIVMDKMQRADASEVEKNVYQAFTTKKDTIISRIDAILTTEFTPLSELDITYQDYMEYICEMLSANGVMKSSIIDRESTEFKAYVNNQTSLADFLQYLISVEAIDIELLEVESNYYDSDEVYSILCEYIVKCLREDTEFDNEIIKGMIQSAEISGATVIDLLYEQGVLDKNNDTEYAEYKNGLYGPYEFFIKKLQNLDITPAMLALSPCSGAVVVTDVDTGDVLAMVSYPSYDNNYLTNEINSEYYNQLLEDETRPMYNRATQQRTAPGSTFKVLSSVAGLSEGVIDTSTSFLCYDVFDKIDPSPKCWYNYGHGYLSVEGAIAASCNMFFYNVGYSLAINEKHQYVDSYGLERLSKYAEKFGLSEVSGVEVPEIEPVVSNNDSVRSAIGQGRNSYAPVQLAKYITAVANSGTCYDLTLIDKVTDYEGNIVMEQEPEVYDTIELSEYNWNTIHSGMRQVVTSYGDIVKRLDVAVAGKTGTAQESDVGRNHALFVSYAPYENPEVAITCVIQNGFYSGNAREVAGFIYAYLYDPEKLVNAHMSGDNVGGD
ncbi:MAG: penicillin-binding transpeptidase domain-containing protein [Clostridium sp.]|nr:penicillin-binding transpeptidase domain-containing protein [Clostridium sp.]MCM1398811.1 penicillin-binding transpeptidase domain-containing protein [Clostridium sp.]MCM1458557.1 penicillin-binding transpeptidase domain-containing protein [Bacteroides sp.]